MLASCTSRALGGAVIYGPRIRGKGGTNEWRNVQINSPLRLREKKQTPEQMAMKWLRFSLLVLGVFSLCCATAGDTSGVKKMKMQFATGPLLKFQIW